LLDKADPLHTRNYGACMSALREDLVDIGGADEHLDYLGHICGPYEMTFRLVNAGRKEIWHPKNFFTIHGTLVQMERETIWARMMDAICPLRHLRHE